MGGSVGPALCVHIYNTTPVLCIQLKLACTYVCTCVRLERKHYLLPVHEVPFQLCFLFQVKMETE